MGRTRVLESRKQVDVWLLHNQVKDMQKVKETIGKSITDQISEAVARYLWELHKAGVL